MISFVAWLLSFVCPPTQNAAPDVEQLLIGNKCDLEEGREVPKQSGELFAQNWNIPFLETSAKSGHNINKVRGHIVISL